MKQFEEQLQSPKTFISFLVALAILMYVIQTADLRKVLQVIRGIHLPQFLGGLLLFYLVLVLKAIRWNYLLAKNSMSLSTFDAIEILLLSQFVNCLVPAKLGDLYRAWLVKKNYSHSGSKVVGTLFVERLFDLVVMFVLVGIVGFSMFGSYQEFKTVVLLGFGLIVLIVAAFACIIYGRQWIAKMLSSQLAGKFQEIVTNFEEGCRNSITPLSFCVLLFLSVLIWFGSAGVLWLVGQSLDAGIGLWLALFVIVISSALGVVPLTPAGLGIVEAGIAGVLVFIGIPSTVAVAVALLERSIDYWSVLVFGFVDFLMTKK